MGLFATKRQPLPRDGGSRPQPAAVTPTASAVEVCELSLDDEEFSSTFGTGASQFADLDTRRDDAKDDPWSSRRRRD
jgi:hypothetical protein